MNAAPAEPFEEFRAKMFATGADEFAEFRSQPTTATSTSTLLSKPRQLMRRFLRLAPGPIQYARAAPVIEEAPHDELHVTLPLPGAHAEDVHVTLHAAELLVSNEVTHATRTITLPSAVLPDASAAFKDGKLSVTLHKCSSPLDNDMHSIMVR
ncbi:hypothetical protein EXIGLDRAFT_726995 [Exidia glandulosa HHB12029]|uniref:ArsA HSP20-like domain-containing protein n=1 Tax=Exidia glandulosa HHB12029 TaxID=1314781 RepID=A0A165DI91_EXIGL|nr:hypothetical protein EXIGLDRAFT_726995 [Exidia glandulosa HHB12029]